MNDDDLDRMFRDGLQARANEVGVDREYAAAARRGAQRRHYVRAGLASAAVLAVIVPAAVISAQRGDDSDGAPAGRLTNQTATGPTSGGATADATATTGTTPPAAVPVDWRVESYGGVQLWVPPDWGWGASPISDFGPRTGVMTCDEPRDGPYVGRPLMLTDLCLDGSLRDQSVAYVWFDSPVDVGTGDLGAGFTQQTVAVGGMHVTAADSDPDELATIIESAQAVDTDSNGCAANLSDSPPLTRTDQDPLTTLGNVESVSVCVYAQPVRRNGALGGDAGRLTYSTQILGRDAQQVVDSLRATPVVHGGLNIGGVYNGRRCLVGEVGLDTPVLLIQGSEGRAVFDVSLTPCRTGYFDGRRFRDLTTANVATWDKDGVGTYTYGANSGFFRGPMG